MDGRKKAGGWIRAGSGSYSSNNQIHSGRRAGTRMHGHPSSPAAGRVDAHVTISSKRASASPPGVSRMLSCRRHAHARYGSGSWRRRTGWTVAWPLRFFCDGPWVGWAAEREALGGLRGAEAKETGPRNGFGPAYALRFNLVCSEFQSVRTKLLPPVKFM